MRMDRSEDTRIYVSYGERHADGQLRWTRARNLTAAKRSCLYREREVFYTTEGTEYGPYGTTQATAHIWTPDGWISC